MMRPKICYSIPGHPQDDVVRVQLLQSSCKLANSKYLYLQSEWFIENVVRFEAPKLQSLMSVRVSVTAEMMDILVLEEY